MINNNSNDNPTNWGQPVPPPPRTDILWPAESLVVTSFFRCKIEKKRVAVAK